MSKKSGYRVVIEDCLAVKKNETVLILTDDKKISIGKSLYEEGKKLAKEAVLMIMEPRKVSGEEPPEVIAEAMKNFDVIICPTSTSITHTNAKINAVKAGARLASMPNITEDMFHEGAITADYTEVEKLTLKLTEILSKTKTAKLIKDDYILEMSLDGRDGVASTGVYKNSGEAGNLPSGEAYIAPVEGSANGEMLVDGSMVGVGILQTPLHMKIVDGRLTEAKGEDRQKIEVLFSNERNGTLGELGIGTNHAARLTGVILEDEKIYGTVHIAFGTNTSFGGRNKADCHLDGVVINPTLYLDDLLVLKEGKFMI
ncbi:Leucyl aminopeptidase (aminopeptidase T) [Anaerovirgula multivorans]|uniref:Leucyl aminopeptidase (Aminopeptidase T) n=1 Tax=Anaerovirgula multivorans TaxID=312168 RepID=A0A239BHT8_9FIRM|nr:aminopeptidase [Anaerovirgula multivorans]SNS07249.1 Leucyl aminopeptidase (aminopeptidase T) [Anaerovirgula multivorans]